jgi:hypothetical protein
MCASKAVVDDFAELPVMPKNTALLRALAKGAHCCNSSFDGGCRRFDVGFKCGFSVFDNSAVLRIDSMQKEWRCRYHG